jgi:hypothetical protein
MSCGRSSLTFVVRQQDASMSVGNDIAEFGFAAIATVAFGIVFVKRPRIILPALGFALALIGVTGVLSGKLPQQYNAAPPLEGGAAFIASIFLIGGGLVVIFLSLRRRPTGTRGSAEPSASPNGGPATRSGDSGVGKGPPSVS